MGKRIPTEINAYGNIQMRGKSTSFQMGPHLSTGTNTHTQTFI